MMTPKWRKPKYRATKNGSAPNWDPSPMPKATPAAIKAGISTPHSTSSNPATATKYMGAVIFADGTRSRITPNAICQAAATIAKIPMTVVAVAVEIPRSAR